MADCNFSIPFSGDPKQVLNKARGAVQAQGGTLTGDDSNGQFQLSVFGSTIAGQYAVVGNELQVQITDKPFMVPCSTIESFLSKQMGS